MLKKCSRHQGRRRKLSVLAGNIAKGLFTRACSHVLVLVPVLMPVLVLVPVFVLVLVPLLVLLMLVLVLVPVLFLVHILVSHV